MVEELGKKDLLEMAKKMKIASPTTLKVDQLRTKIQELLQAELDDHIFEEEES